MEENKIGVEELKASIKKFRQENQLNFVKRLLEDIEYYAESTVREDYDPSEEERAAFGRIVAIVKGINEYL